jgi:hypothetical protein
MDIKLELPNYVPGYYQAATLDNRRIAYTRDTDFLIQIGKGKSKYKTKMHIKGSLAQAVMQYNGLNIANGYKKRLIAYGYNKPILARQLS